MNRRSLEQRFLIDQQEIVRATISRYPTMGRRLFARSAYPDVLRVVTFYVPSFYAS
ncbi:hypothetical protein [Bordetella muralis]|uniref:hypothetical protein n=1 Tax=Bordetella muralis TaxID=1649130 RepID=UPI0039EE61CC